MLSDFERYAEKISFKVLQRWWATLTRRLCPSSTVSGPAGAGAASNNACHNRNLNILRDILRKSHLKFYNAGAPCSISGPAGAASNNASLEIWGQGKQPSPWPVKVMHHIAFSTFFFFPK